MHSLPRIRLFEKPNQQTKRFSQNWASEQRKVANLDLFYLGLGEILRSTLLPKQTSGFESVRFRAFLLGAVFDNPLTSFLCFRLTTLLLLTESNHLYWCFSFFKHSGKFYFLNCNHIFSLPSQIYILIPLICTLSRHRKFLVLHSQVGNFTSQGWILVVQLTKGNAVKGTSLSPQIPPTRES